MFCKIANGELEDIPKSMTIDGCVVIGYTEEFANAHGYYAVIWIDPPEESDDYVPIYTLIGNKITMTWSHV